MFYQSQRRKLECTRIVKKNDINDIYICRDVNAEVNTLYTLLVIKEHALAKTYLDLFDKTAGVAGASYVECFTDGGRLCVLFEYRPERPLKDFYMGEICSRREWEEICARMITACRASKLPYPLLYLILKQGQLHLGRDNSVYLGYQTDLRDLDAGITEQDCVLACASILRELLPPKADGRGFRDRILEKKIARQSYQNFGELYQDICLAQAPARKGFGTKLWLWLWGHRELFCRILLWICVLLGGLAVVSLLSQLMFGEIPWLRLFLPGFEKIGTQSLTG